MPDCRITEAEAWVTGSAPRLWMEPQDKEKMGQRVYGRCGVYIIREREEGPTLWKTPRGLFNLSDVNVRSYSRKRGGVRDLEPLRRPVVRAHFRERARCAQIIRERPGRKSRNPPDAGAPLSTTPDTRARGSAGFRGVAP
ncbi:hypothetical protein MRX96_028547 [Rhipicephalus microplus]